MTESDPDRIPRFVAKLEGLWRLEPELRLGQVLRNVVQNERLFRDDGSEHTLSLFDDSQWELWFDEALRRLEGR